MKVQYSPGFYRQYKKASVRIRNNADERIRIFRKNPHDLQLNNHPLKKKWHGHRSIDITANYRAVYEELDEGKDTIAYFVALGTHKDLYR